MKSGVFSVSLLLCLITPALPQDAPGNSTQSLDKFADFLQVKAIEKALSVTNAGEPVSTTSAASEPINREQPEQTESGDRLFTAFVTAGGAVLGALIAAITAAYSSRQKIREIVLHHEQQIHNKYLSNAREYTNSVYLPLNIALTNLSEAYQSFRVDVDFENQLVDEAAREKFVTACNAYLEITKELFAKGADAFLTTALDESLRSFNVFLSRSLTAKKPVVKVAMEYRFGASGLSTEGKIAREIPAESKWDREIAKSVGKMSMWLWGFGEFAIRFSDVLAAPIETREFEERMINDISMLKTLVKHVTLGSHVGAS